MTPDVRPLMLAELEKGRVLWTTARPAAYSLKLTTVYPEGQAPEVSTVRDGKAVSGNTTIESVFDRLADGIRTADLAAIASTRRLDFPRSSRSFLRRQRTPELSSSSR